MICRQHLHENNNPATDNAANATTAPNHILFASMKNAGHMPNKENWREILSVESVPAEHLDLSVCHETDYNENMNDDDAGKLDFLWSNTSYSGVHFTTLVRYKIMEW